MKSAKIHILDELEEIRLECQKKSSPYSIFVPENEIVHRKKIKNISKQLTIQTDENSQQFDRYIELNRQKSSESPDNRHTKEFSLHEFCETYISTLLNEEYVKKVVCKILGISYHHLLIQNISSILRDPHCSSTIIADIFDPNHIKLSNPERLYSSLESQFGAVKTTMLSLDKNPSRVLSLIKLRGPDNKRLPPGMVILLHPATTTYHEKYQFKLRYRSAITKQTCIESIIFWGNGNLYSNHMTTVHNLPSCYTAEESDDHKANDRRLSMIPLGGDQQEHLKNSLPGYNGRIPIWIPSLEVEITLEEKMMCHGIPETDEDEDFCPPLTPIQKTDRNDNEQDRVLSAESFDYSIERQKAKDKNLMRLNFSHSYNSLLDEHVKSLIKQPSMTSTSRSHFDHGNTSLLFSTPYVNPVATSPTLSYHLGSPNGARRNIYLSSPNSQQIVIHLKYFACQSLEATLHQLAAITARCQRQAIASLTLPGNVPALNNACLYGNIHVTSWHH